MLYNEVGNLLRTLLERILKEDVLQVTNPKLATLDLDNQENFLANGNIKIGYTTKQSIKLLQKESEVLKKSTKKLSNANQKIKAVSEKDVALFRKDCGT